MPWCQVRSGQIKAFGLVRSVNWIWEPLRERTCWAPHPLSSIHLPTKGVWWGGTVWFHQQAGGLPVPKDTGSAKVHREQDAIARNWNSNPGEEGGVLPYTRLAMC